MDDFYARTVIQINDIEWVSEVSDKIANAPQCSVRPKGSRFEDLVFVCAEDQTERKSQLQRLTKMLELRKNQLS